MAEQWPFKPFVEGSTPPELTERPPKLEVFYFVECPRKEDDIRLPPSSQKDFLFLEFFCCEPLKLEIASAGVYCLAMNQLIVFIQIV